MAHGDIVLVCDIGGGTADFSLIAVTDVEGDLELERISVGEHILLGGDNMDLALAYALQAKLEAEGKSLDSWQFLALVHAASKAKISLFEDGALAQAPIAVPSRGSSLFARTICHDTRSRDRCRKSFSTVSSPEPHRRMPREARREGCRNSACPTRPIP